MGKQKSKGKKAPGRGREKTERKTAKAEEKRSRREAAKKANDEDDISAILVWRLLLTMALCCARCQMQCREAQFRDACTRYIVRREGHRRVEAAGGG